MMNVRDDYVLRMISLLAEMIRKMLGGSSIDESKIDDIISELLGIDLQGDRNIQFMGQFMHQIINLATRDDENKKALIACCLYLKDRHKYSELTAALRKDLNFNILSPDVQALIHLTFDVENETNDVQA